MPRDGLLRRLRRRRLDPSTFVLLPDSHPRRGLIAEPVRVARLEHERSETAAGADWVRIPDTAERVDHADPTALHRVTFLVEVRAADGARCPNVSVEVRIGGPERERTVSAATDMLGRVRFRMSGPVGCFHCEVLDVAAGGLDWDRDAGPLALDVDLSRRADPA